MNLLGESGTGFRTIRILGIILMTVGAISLSTMTVNSKLNKSIIISDGTTKIQVKTNGYNAKEALQALNVKLNKEDGVSPSLETRLTSGMQIDIKRATPIKLIADGKEQNVLTNKTTVEEFLEDQQIALNENDKLNVDPTQNIIKDLVLKVTRVRKDTIVEREQIAFKTSERTTTSVSRGSRRVTKEGKQGLKENIYEVTYEDNNIVNKQLIDEKIISKPTNAVVEIGYEPFVYSSRGGELSASKVIVMQASAYTAGYESTGKNPGDRGYGRTATGITAKRGVVAVDPRVIPLGTKLYIEGTNGFGDYGYAIAADTGGAIKGNKIDLFYESLSDAIRFGRRSVKVYIIE